MFCDKKICSERENTEYACRFGGFVFVKAMLISVLSYAILRVMNNRNKILYLFVAAFSASFVPYLVFDFFDTPFAHGLLCWDALLLLAALCSPRFSKREIAVCVLLLITYVVYDFSTSGAMLAGYYALLLFVNLLLPRKKMAVLICFAVFALVAVFADASVFFYNTFRLHFGDVWGLAKFFWWGLILFFAIPGLCVAIQFLFARKILWGETRLELPALKWLALLVVVFLLYLGSVALQERLPLLSYPVKNAVEQMFLKGTVSKSVMLQQDAKEAFAQWKDDKTPFVFDKPTLQILVESWGVNKNVAYTQKILNPYSPEDPTFLGFFLRETSYTQGAEMEDMNVHKNSNPEVFSFPARFKTAGFQTWYVHGYEGNFYNRKENYGSYGFDSLYFMDEFVQKGLAKCKFGFTGICDSSIVTFLDSLMTDSVPKYIYWTTLDTHPPYEKSVAGSDCEKSENRIECIYTELQLNTAAQIVKLARKHPEYRIIVRGDHRPMGSLGPGFVSSFYYRWVPMVVFH